MCEHVYMHARTHTHTCTHARMHTHTHTSTGSLLVLTEHKLKLFPESREHTTSHTCKPLKTKNCHNKHKHKQINTNKQIQITQTNTNNKQQTNTNKNVDWEKFPVEKIPWPTVFWMSTQETPFHTAWKPRACLYTRCRLPTLWIREVRADWSRRD